MTTFKRIPMAALAIVVSTVAAMAWVALDGTVPLLISMAAGTIVAVRSTMGDAEPA